MINVFSQSSTSTVAIASAALVHVSVGCASQLVPPDDALVESNKTHLGVSSTSTRF